MSKLGSAVLYLRLRARLTLPFFPPPLCSCRRRLRRATLFLVAVGDVLPISFVVTVVATDILRRHPCLASVLCRRHRRPTSVARCHCSTACLCRRCCLRPTSAAAVVNVFVTVTGVLHATT